MQEVSARTLPVDSLLLYEALSNVYFAKFQDENFATSKANRIFENSVCYAYSKWNLEEGCDNFFQEEAIRMKSSITIPEKQSSSKEEKQAMFAGMIAD